MHFCIAPQLYWLADTSVGTHANSFILAADVLYTKRPWALGVAFFLLMSLASQIGFWLAGKSRVKGFEEIRQRSASVETAVLGVLALLLGFTLAMAVTRFDTRRTLVVEEANAIGTAYWRSQLIPAPEGPEVAALLREYVNAKLHYFDAGSDPDQLQASRERIAQLQKELWSQAAASAQKDPRSVPAGLLLQSLNQTFDLETSRWIALTIHLPDGVLLVDMFVGLLAALLVGYNFGITGRRHFASSFVLAVCIATVMAVIIDLDQPRQGLIRVGQQALVDLYRQVEEK